jgi:Transglutaminase-like enzymes, putative cysteine proteases
MTQLSVRHLTSYRYANPVRLEDHRLMCRPRDSHDLRLLETGLRITPTPSRVRWLHDPLGNSIAIVSFETPTANLEFESSFRAEHFPAEGPAIELEPYASRYPFNYAFDQIPDLARCVERHYPDPDRRIDRWTRALLRPGGDDSLDLMTRLTQCIRDAFEYVPRDEMGTQTPLETLALATGSCRDFALFMMEAVRSLGLAARFVSGYLYDEALVGASGGMVGGGATHAWVQVYLPGAGWVEFDPTNALVGGRNLIRVAVARDVYQAVPVAGSFVGATNDFLGMQVQVEVTAH